MKSLSSDLEVDVFGIPFGRSGWATHTSCFARAMNELLPVSYRAPVLMRLALLMTRDRPMAWRGLHSKPQRFGIAIVGKPFPGQLSARWNVWETTRLPTKQQELCQTTTFVWSPSTWGRQNLIANGIDPKRIALVPEGVDVEFFRPRSGVKSGPFRFLFVGKWETRKFIDGLVRAFADEFSRDESVELVLHAHNPYERGFSIKTKLERLGVSTRANIRPSKPASRISLRRQYQSADCFVFPTRAEGWGLPILESMACGVPAIVTRYGAPLDFVTEENGYLLDVRQMVDANCDFFDIHTGKWAEPDAHHLRCLMRQAFENSEQVREKGAIARKDALRFSWKESAKIALSTIRKATSE